MHFAELYPPGVVLWATALVWSLSSRMALPDHNLSQPQPLEDVGTIPELNLYEVKKLEAVFNQLTFAQDMLRYLLPSDNSILLTNFPAHTCLILTIEYYTSCFRNEYIHSENRGPGFGGSQRIASTKSRALSASFHRFMNDTSNHTPALLHEG